LNKNFHIIFISGAVAKIDEQIKVELLNNSFLNLLGELDKVKVLELLNTLNKKNNSSTTLNVNLIYPNGKQFWVNLTLNINFEVDDSIIIVNINPLDQQTTIQNSLFLNRNSSLLESVVANISEGVMIIELDSNLAQQSKIIYVNKAFPLLTGYNLNELQGNSPKFLQASLTDESYVFQLKKSIFEGIAFDSTLPCRKKNGELYWAEASFSPLKNENEMHTNWIITFRDVTARKELEDVLRKASTLAGIGSWAYEPKTRKIFWSNMTKHIYEVGSDFNPDVENTAKFFKHTKQNQFILDQISEGITAGKAFDLEVEILTAKKNKKWIRIIGEPEIRNENCQKISGSFQDIDQRKKAQLLAEKSIQEKNEIFESIADGFFAVDKKWKITFWNSRAAEEVNRSKEELLNQNLWDVFS
ncbi:MAG: PAS domain S-box protein, partial [Pedobacter sp.]